MARAKRRAPARKRVARRKGYRKYGPSTRKGQVRKTARRAFERKRPARRRRSNPRGIMDSPAFMFGAVAVAGAATAAVLNNYGDAAKKAATTKAAAEGTEPKFGLWAVLSPKIGEYQLHPGVVGAALTLGLASTKLVKRAKTRQNLVAAGVGMLAPAAIDAATQAFEPKSNPRHISAHRLARMRRLNSGSSFAPTSSYVSANHFASDLIG
jgi:hypothetical protein